MIRKATIDDLPEILKIYEDARLFMAANGNPTQWGTSHPEKSMLEKNINEGVLYVIVENDIIGVFAFIIGEDSTYDVIDGGNWHSNDCYGTIHRLAAKAGQHGIFSKSLEYCKTMHNYIRIDTHENNKKMQHNIEKAGFSKCGIIYAYDGSPRIAYDINY